MDREKIIEDLQQIEEDVNLVGYRGQNEWNLEFRERIADYIIKLFAIPAVNGWLDYQSNEDLFNEESKKNCLCKFEDGTIIRYDENHPMEVMTHFKLAEASH